MLRISPLSMAFCLLLLLCGNWSNSQPFHTPKCRTLEKMHLHFFPSATIHLWKKLDFSFYVILLSPLTGTWSLTESKKKNIIKDNHKRKSTAKKQQSRQKAGGKWSLCLLCRGGNRLPSPDGIQCPTAQAIETGLGQAGPGGSRSRDWLAGADED